MICPLSSAIDSPLFINLGSIIGALDTLESQSISRERYVDNGILPDWFTGEQAA